MGLNVWSAICWALEGIYALGAFEANVTNPQHWNNNGLKNHI